MTRRVKWSDDSGVTLLLALIVVGVVATVTTALLSQSFTNTKATESARTQGSAARAADAAGKFAVNQIRQISNNVGSFCSTLGTTATETLSGFYPATVTAPQMSATIQCRPDTNDPGPNPPGGSCTPGNACANSGPGTALLTLDTAGSGIYESLSKPSDRVLVHGGVFSNSAITINKGSLENTWCPTAGCSATSPHSYMISRGACSASAIVMDQTGVAPICNYAVTNDRRGADPQLTALAGSSYNAPSIPAGNAVISSCTSSTCTPGTTCSGSAKYQKVTAGRFVGAAALASLNALTGCSSGNVQFAAGVYYFNLGGTWSVPNGVTVVGGNLASGYDPTKASSTWPDYNACVAPSGSSPSSGVEFVVGGDSHFFNGASSGSGSHLTLCASTTTDGPPMAIYGLKASTAPSGTTPEITCAPSGGSDSPSGCSVIQTANCPKCSLSVQGSIYVPNSVIDLVLNNNASANFNWGVVTNGIIFGATGSASLTSPLVSVPDGQPSPFPVNVYYLSVYVCPGTSACPTGGTANLQAAIQTQSTPNNASVLSWSVNR